MKRRYGVVSLALVLSVLVAMLAAVVMVRQANAIPFELHPQGRTHRLHGRGQG